MAFPEGGAPAFPAGRLGVVTAPESGAHSPARTRRSDVLPEPFGPVISRLRPGSTTMDTRSTSSL